jgi:hypothetical protein
MKNARQKKWQRQHSCSGQDKHQKMVEIYHLITDSGTFLINSDGIIYEVRDATEVGAANLRSCTPAVLSALNSLTEPSLQ